MSEPTRLSECIQRLLHPCPSCVTMGRVAIGGGGREQGGTTGQYIDPYLDVVSYFKLSRLS